MSATSERIRADLVANTGVDFAAYRDDDLIDALSGWSGILGLATDLLIGLAGGIALVVGIGALVAAAAYFGS